MPRLLEEFRYAARQLARTPGFTLVALATLALAIGATTAVFSLADGVLLKPLAFRAPDRLVYLAGADRTGTPNSISALDLIDYRNQTHSFTDIVSIDGGHNLNLTRASGPALRISAARVGATFFDVLGVPTALGRAFGRGDDARDASKVVVLSDAAWRRYFNADPRIIGTTVTLNGVPRIVIGVAPRSLTFPDNPDVWYPAVWQDVEIAAAARDSRTLHAIARLRPGVSQASAERDLSAVAARIAAEYPEKDAGVSASITSLRAHIVGDVERPLWAMLGAVLFVLLIASANVANLLLVRAASRTSEVAIRTALGAGRSRLVRQFLIESMVLAGAGAFLGTVVGLLSIRAAAASTTIPRVDEVGVDWRVLAFATVLTIVTGLGFGLVPALQASGWDIAPVLRSGRAAHGGRRARVRTTLVIAELTLGTILLVGAGLLIRSFQRLMHVDPGFRAEHLIAFDVAPSGHRYDTDAGMNAFTDAVERQLSALPGVTDVAAAANRPFDPDPSFEGTASFTVDGRPRPAPGAEPSARFLPVSPSFFSTIGVTLIRGRLFDESDNRREAAPVVIINQTMANRYFPGQNPIGQHITFDIAHKVSSTPGDTLQARGEIIGVVKDVRFGALKDEPGPATFFPLHTEPFGATFILRTNLDAASLARPIQQAVAAVDPSLPTFELGTMSTAMASSVSQPRFYTTLLTGFALVALLLASLGVYGVISYTVSQETRDFGIRIALGARSRDVIHHVIRRGTALIGAGLTIGILGAVVLTRVLREILFGVDPLDAPTFAAVCLVFASVGLFASWLPARRAARVDPIIAMKSE